MRGWALAATIAALGASGTAEARARYEATIVRTKFGIPHITANTWQGIGYGVGYAYATDNLCMMAEEFATIRGERSLHWGPNERATLGFQSVDNLSSDVFFRGAIDLDAVRRGAATQSREARLVTAGYVAGYNRRLRELGPTGAPEACRGKAWLRPITDDDMLRLNAKSMLLASSLALAPGIANAAPPGKAAAKAPAAPLPKPEELGVGSNGWAFGGDATANGRGLVIGNPHFPWFGPSRFWQMHVTLPGKYDVMGVSTGGGPIPTLGFNKDVAWTHTVTAARHFTLFQLRLDPADPTRYLVDGKPEAMTRREVSVPMPGGAAPVTRTLYSTRFGPVVVSPAAGLTWGATAAFAMRDANVGNRRALDTWLAIGRARNVGEVRAAPCRSAAMVLTQGMPSVRSTAALHADVTAVPNVSAEKVKACATPLSALAAAQATLLDGSRSACDWDRVAGTPTPGLMPARDQMVLERRDYVTNSNDSYWLSNPRAPFRQLSPVLGAHGTAVSLRTRSNFVETDAMLAGKVDHVRAQALVFANKSLAADLAIDPLLALCAGRAEVARACAALKGWDRRFDNDSRGAALFAQFWTKVRTRPGLWTVPFAAGDPVNTPRGFMTSGDAGPALIKALAEAAAELERMGFAPDARWGDVHAAPRGTERIPVHGGPGMAGVLNVQEPIPAPVGLQPRHGTSYIQVVGFDDTGPIADAILSYSQSTDPASPHYGDQTREYAAKRWHRLPFAPGEIAAAALGPAVLIAE
jgi:acyl-homoserine-lactone acylase